MEQGIVVSGQELNLMEAVSKEIVTTSLDLGVDYTEIGLDKIFSSDLVKDIPVVKTIFAIAKVGLGIREKFFTKKLLSFLKEFHSNKIDCEKLNDFRQKFDYDIRYREQVTEHIVVFVDAFLSIDKARIIAKLFCAHINGSFGWEHFLHLSSCLDSINPKAFMFLEKLSKYDFIIPEEPSERGIERDLESEALLSSSGIAYDASVWSSSFKVSQLGKDLFDYGLK